MHDKSAEKIQLKIKLLLANNTTNSIELAPNAFFHVFYDSGQILFFRYILLNQDYAHYKFQVKSLKFLLMLYGSGFVIL